mmetsp:Transcript_9200/g.13505  ORF Transcript_9200/g.13505 Transcript_9200/m.13505 type:complete len:211 (-) Transcript_9200:37-669(-)|eukprot:CAMPEP_0197251480 /NCGR_PEP_ID=MMETSP1429-20130617/57340_1 /TAXON_ID=49237 /ORGANISM="Chaetoceros  sp., Strain UNC1202" /LENGTH=210 /DNA_ID=CAMNT_0042713567 /DNA_START=12 /DNA_END=644 /DNA_ORIENTATION=-
MSSSVPSGLIKGVHKLLEQVLSNRANGKVKDVAMSGLETLVICAALFMSFMDMDIENWLETYIILGASASYAILLSVLCIIHSSCTPKGTTTKQVEDAYTATNLFPIIDGILELGFPVIFGGKMWYLPLIMWVFFLAILISGILFFGKIETNLTDKGMAVTEALLLYQMTSDFAEYWTHTRNQEKLNVDSSDSPTNESLASSSYQRWSSP